MRFDNLGAKVAGELLGSFPRQPEEHVDSDAEIRCKHNRQRPRGLFNHSALVLRMTGRPNDQWPAMLEGGRADITDRVRIAEIDRHIAIFHSRLNRIAKIALPDDVDLRVAHCKITYGSSHATSAADQQYVHARIIHSRNPSPKAED